MNENEPNQINSLFNDDFEDNDQQSKFQNFPMNQSMIQNDDQENQLNETIQKIVEQIQPKQTSSLNIEAKQYTPNNNTFQLNPENFNVQNSSNTSTVKSSDEVDLREYQQEIYNLIEKQWFEDQNKYGSIIFMATGSGKTFVAIMLILRIFKQQSERILRKQTDIELRQKQDKIAEMQQDRKNKPKVAFMVPTNHLVEQQADAINQHTDLFVGKYSGNHNKSQKSLSGDKQFEHWRLQMSVFDVFVFTEKKLYDVMKHGFVKIEEFDMIVFDECHHAYQSHYYNLIMEDFFFYDYTEGCKRPKILGLTASPIKEKVGDSFSTNVEVQIREKLQNLANNLYSKFVCITLDQIKKMENQQTSVIIEQYDFKIEEKVDQINHIKKDLIMQLCKLIDIDEKTVKINDPYNQLIQNSNPSIDSREKVLNMSLRDQLELSIEKLMMDQFEELQDHQVVKFLKRRYELISIDMKYVKTNISIQSFKNQNDQILLIFIIIILKNANELILELGSFSFMQFLREIKQDLFSRMEQGAEKTKMAMDIVDNFNIFECSPQKSIQVAKEMDQSNSISKKVCRLIQLLNNELKTQKKAPKVIIFVKDRVVAQYLKEILERQVKMRAENPHREDYLHQSYKVAMAMGPRGKNLVNKAFRSTKPTTDVLSDSLDTTADDSSSNISKQNMSITKDVKKFQSFKNQNNQTQTQGGVKMSNNQLKEVLQKFKLDQINVLIATNVVEEGLDVSECNLVICMNEMLNVKAFIQMKGRARQTASKFIFLCANQEYEDVLKDKKNFGVVINSMKEQAFGRGDSIWGAIEPDQNVQQIKIPIKDEYFEVPSTGARLSMRDSRLLLDNFCKIAADCAPTVHLEEEKDPIKKLSKHVQEFEPYLKTTISGENQENQKFYFTCIFMPKSCTQYLTDGEHRIMPETGFLKKKDSENHVAMLALKQLHKNEFLDDYLLPKIGGFVMKFKNRQNVDKPQTSSGLIANNIDVPLIQSSPYLQSGAVRKVIIPFKEVEAFKQEQIDFERELKSNKSKFVETVEEGFRSLVKEKIAENKSGQEIVPPTVYIHCLKDKQESNNKFPFKNTRDHLGIVFGRQFKQTNPTRFWMFQEKKQKDKNKEYLSLMLQNQFIDQKYYDELHQEKEMIELELNKTNLIKINFKTFVGPNGSLTEAKRRVQLLKFFHTWVFYYFYCADHKFIKHILKNKFTFVSTLFKEQLDYLYNSTVCKKRIFKVYCPKDADHFEKEYVQNHKQRFIDDRTLLELHPYIVPLLDKNGKLEVNWKQIEKIQERVANKLMDIVFLCKSRQVINKSYNLDKTFIPLNFKATLKCNSDFLGIWDDKFTGVRYVKLARFRQEQKWDIPVLHLERRQAGVVISGDGETSTFKTTVVVADFKDQIPTSSPIQSISPGNGKQSIQSKPLTARGLIIANKDQRMDIFTVQQYNYDKYGMFLNPLSNPFLYEVRKERHFVDFSKTPRQMEKENSIQVKVPEVQSAIQVSSKFDITEQLIERSPLSYNQYQVFQQSCTHLLYFNEFLQVEKFIRDKFKGFKCFLEERDQSDIDKLNKTQQSNNLSIDQKISQAKENLQSALEPSLLSRNIFLSPDALTQDKQMLKNKKVKHVLAQDQLLNNIDLMMEALTAPNANRNYDYERLEFYGDSVISFLVILELFLTKEYAFKEGHLDFYRIQQVSNMTFFKINKKEQFFKYMINEPQTIFNDFVPGAFEQIKYQERIKHKTLNEINNKVKELRKLDMYLTHLIDKKEEFMDQLLLPQIRKYLLENNMGADKSLMPEVSSFAQDQIYMKPHGKDKILNDREIMKKYKKKVEGCISKITTQKINKINEIEANKQKNSGKRSTHKKQFFFKQLADIVESVTGAATVACGLNLTQNYLRGINVLRFTQHDLITNLVDLKRKKAQNRQTQEFVQIKMDENGGKLREIEGKIGYTFKSKLWLVEALTHKSYIDQNKPAQDRQNYLKQNQSQITISSEIDYNQNQCNPEEVSEDELMPIDDYERLEFLGDAILNFLIAEHFYKTTVNDKEKKMPKELHKMKTSVINNALLSLIVIENGIHEHVLYNNKAFSFKEQFDKYVSKVQELLAGNEGGSTRNSEQALDLDQLYEYNLKIFGDVFESIIGAIFIDSECITTTWKILYNLMAPYIDKYANLQTLQDHSRTKLLELWNQKIYMRNLKCHHETRKPDDSGTLQIDTRIIFCGMVDEVTVFEIWYDKDAKNKVRSFYRQYYRLIGGFFETLEKGGNEQFLALTKEEIIKKIHNYKAKHFKRDEEVLQEGMEIK